MEIITKYLLERESFEKQLSAGRYNPAYEIVFWDDNGVHRHTICSGSSDEIYVFRQENMTIVLSVNNGLGYVGIEVFEGEERIADAFYQEWHADDMLGNEELMPVEIAEILLNRMEV